MKMVASKFWIFFVGYSSLCVRFRECILSDFSYCHTDMILNPQDGLLSPGTFTWLGFVQYLHKTTGLSHHSTAPRVVLIHKQFALGTAHDLIRVPLNYKLGKVIFADYERDEDECGLTYLQITFGLKCPRAYMEMPLTDIIPHPEFTRFGVGNSLAIIKLLRPMRSNYMLPICLPTIEEREILRGSKVVFLVDYTDTVPSDFNAERMGKKTVKLFTHRECRRHRMRTRLGSEGVTHVLCTSGCGIRPGTPILIHSNTGSFQLVGLAVGGAPCVKKRHRFRMNPDPPVYIDIYPYHNWIVNVISAHLMPDVYPTQMLRAGDDTGDVLRQGGGIPQGWQGRTFVSGQICFRNSKFIMKKNIIFYFEQFQANAEPAGANLTMHMHLIAPPGYTIICAKLGLPNQKKKPKIWGVYGRNVSMFFNSGFFPRSFYFDVSLFAKNKSSFWTTGFSRWKGSL